MTEIIIASNVEPLDIWRSARLMVKRHGGFAPIECAQMADDMLEKGDIEGQAVWLAVRRAAKALLDDGTPADIFQSREQ